MLSHDMQAGSALLGLSGLAETHETITNVLPALCAAVMNSADGEGFTRLLPLSF